jgi:hypothetical protein
MTRISLEQKGTKETKEEFFFVAFVCFCANFILWAAWMENSQSVKSVQSVVHSLWLRLTALRPPVQTSSPYLRQSASICGQFRLPLWPAALRPLWLQFLLCYTFMVLCASAQIQQAWVARYNNGMTNGTNQAVKMALDPAGNIYVTGFSENSRSNLGYATVKYAPNGTQLWTARYDSTNYPAARPSALVLDNSNNVIVTGSALTVKYDTYGNRLWTAPYAGSALAVDTNGNAFVTGFGTNFNTVKLSSMGSNLWLETYQDVGPTVGQAIAVDNSGNAYVVGSDVEFYWLDNGYGYNLWIPQVGLLAIKYTSTGTQAWLADYTYMEDLNKLTTEGVALDNSNNLYVVSDLGVGWGYTTFKFASNGSLSWFTNPASDGDLYGLTLDKIGDVLVTGEGLIGNCLFTWDINTNGSLRWSSVSAIHPAPPSAGLAIAVDSANNCYVTGYSEGTNSYTGIVTIKYDNNGNIIWLEPFSGPGNGNDEGNAIAVDAGGNVYVAGYDTMAGGGTEMVLIKYSPGPFVTKQGNGDFLLQAVGVAGESFDFQASTDLQTWQDLGTNTADTNGAVQFLDTNAPLFNQRFYLANPQ